MAEKNSSQKEQLQQVLITREFDAPRDLVFKAWTDCEHLIHWWGPKGFYDTSLQDRSPPGRQFS
jgi:uncharacterized protein YndB with AHSA1/START domain